MCPKGFLPLIILMAAAVGLSGCGTGAVIGPPAAASRIVFASDRDGNFEIYAMRADGSSPTRLTFTTPAADLAPALRPDGQRIAFIENNRIFIMNADGSGVHEVFNGNAGGGVRSLAWSPDGGRIAFEYLPGGWPQIYVMNADGSGAIALTADGQNNFQPAWSPDGTKIVFTSTRDGNPQIYVMNADGSAQTRLTNNSADDSNPAYRPDGSRIAFQSNRDANLEIYAMDASGMNQTRVTTNSASDTDPVYSPDGSKIAYVSDRDLSDWEIYAMNADGTTQTRLTVSAGRDQQPDWR